ncbi:MAG: hypothetical protein ACHRHE_09370 [Tepidisphaerales bacterium]
MSLSNCSFWGPIERCVWMRSPLGQFTASACNFVDWDNQGKGTPAIQLDAGKAIIQACTFAREGTDVQVGQKVRSAVLAANQADGGFHADNRAGGRTQMMANEQDAFEQMPEARQHYRRLMTDSFTECRRILRNDGVLTVMFTHKKQEAWEALFMSLIRSGFKIMATWPVKTEGCHSLHQAKNNAAQSAVILVARKRPPGAGVGYFGQQMKQEIRHRARKSAERLMNEGLNPVDQLVGSFGPAMEVYSQYDEVRTDTGQPVGVDRAIDEASDAVSQWRIDLHAERGLEGVESKASLSCSAGTCWGPWSSASTRRTCWARPSAWRSSR